MTISSVADVAPMEVLSKAVEGKRIGEEEALSLFNADPLALGMAADRVRRRFHPDETISFIIDRNISYTNVCVADCTFCAFYRRIGAPDAYLLDLDTILKRVQEAVDLGASRIMFQGGLHPSLKIDWYENVFRRIREKFGGKVQLHLLSPAEIVHIAKFSRLSFSETLGRLKDAGMQSLPGGGGEILVDEIREKMRSMRVTSDQWLEIMETAQKMGMPATATMMFGHIEGYADRIEHLRKVRALQDKTKGFISFIPWTYQPGNNKLGGRETGSVDYLKTLAICRIYLDNFVNVQASTITQDNKLAQVAFSFGANDAGEVALEENVVEATGVSYRVKEVDDMVRLIKGAGKIPAQRDTLYNILRLYS